MSADQFLIKAKESVIKAEPILDLKFEEIYVVWFCKTLGNWKALISTDVMSNAYWEVTHNGARQETYVDSYKKVANTAIKDAE